jgi:hypothetical protein
MRYRATSDNLVIEVPAPELEEWIGRVVRLLVPRYTSKVYFLADSEPPFDGLRRQAGLAVVRPGQEPSNFLQSFRLLFRGGELIVVSSPSHRFGREEWRAFAEALAPSAT